MKKIRITSFLFLIAFVFFLSFTLFTNHTCAKGKKYVKSLNVTNAVSLKAGEKIEVPVKVKVVNKASKKISYNVKDSGIAKVSFNNKTSKLTINGLQSGQTVLVIKTKAKNKKGKKLSRKVKITVDDASSNVSNTTERYTFRKPQYPTEHYAKHGESMGYKNEAEYLAGANAVINNPSALHKLEAEDNDHVYYIESTNEIVFLSQDGFIRTYFICSGKAYFDRQ
jgi:pyocin large subunit-like protein